MVYWPRYSILGLLAGGVNPREKLAPPALPGYN